jgi:hypothetical protein
MNKICSRCKQEFPATAEYFVVDKRNSNGLGALCRTCEKARIQKYSKAHPEKGRERQQKFEERNPGRVTELKRDWRHKNPDKVKEAKSKHRASHHEEILASERQFKDKNREKIRDYNRRRKREADRLEDLRRHRAQREARKLNLPDTLTKEEWLSVVEHWQGCCVYCGKQPESLTLDHYIPLVSPNCPGTVAINIVPACLSCNSSKNNTEAFYWMSWKFGSERANEIQARISSYFEKLSQ